jgi:hypothetical protein
MWGQVFIINHSSLWGHELVGSRACGVTACGVTSLISPIFEKLTEQFTQAAKEDGNGVANRYTALNGLSTETPKLLKSPTLRVTTVSL